MDFWCSLTYKIFVLLFDLGLFLCIVKKKLGYYFIALSIFFITVILFTPFIYVLFHKEESVIKEPLCFPKEKNINILILGGGHSEAHNLINFEILSQSSKNRLIKGLSLYKKIKKSKIVTSGYCRLKRRSQAKIMADAALDFGVNSRDTFQLTKPKKTDEECSEYKKKFLSNKSFYLVTSAYHMRRALISFKKIGLNPIPVPTDYQTADYCFCLNQLYYSPRKIILSDLLLHEYLGDFKILFSI